MYQVIEVIERNAPKMQFTCYHRRGKGLRPIDLTDVQAIEFYLKPTADDDDPVAPQYSLANAQITIEGDPKKGVINVQWNAAHVPAPGTQWHHLDVIFGGNRDTVSHGPVKVVNI